MTKTKSLPINISIMSIGGRGANILERLPHLEKSGVKRIAFGTSNKIFNRLDVKDKIEIAHHKQLQNTNLTDDTIRALVEENSDAISKSLDNTDVLFLVGNIANRISTIHADVIANLAKQKDTLVFFVSATPFSFEGQSKTNETLQNIEHLEEMVDGVMTIDSNKLINNETTAMQAMTKVDVVISDMVETIVDLVLKFGVVNVDFADLRTTVRNAGEIFFNSVSGKIEELEDIGKNIFDKTYLVHQSKDKLNKILYVIYAGKNVLMDEINRIGSLINKQVGTGAQIIFGVVNEDKMNDQIRVVLIGA